MGNPTSCFFRQEGIQASSCQDVQLDLTAIINSDEIQSVLRPKQTTHVFRARKKNPLNNFGFMVKLNPYAIPARRAEILRSHPGSKRAASEKEVEIAKAKSKKGQAAKKRRSAFYTQLKAPVK